MIRFTDREMASAALADIIANRLRRELDNAATATFVASGGSSPVRCYQILSEMSLDWDRVSVTLSDERCVPADHHESNERLIRENLLSGKAARARFIALEEGRFQGSVPFACTLLGMGTDGHFASLFPDSPQLSEGLAGSDDVIRITTPSSPYQRVSMTLGLLLKSRAIVLLAFGEEKRLLLEKPAGYPVSHLMQSPLLEIYWAP